MRKEDVKTMSDSARMRNPDLLYPELSYDVVGAIFEVWKKLGPGFKESIYQNALKEELKIRHIPFESQKNIPIYYNDKKVGIYVPDFLIDGKIIIEIKHLPRLTVKEDRQIWYYLKGTEYKLLFLVNFGDQKLEIKRRIYDKARLRNASK